MAEVNITLNVNDEQFQEILQNGLTSLSSEKVGEIILKAFEQYLFSERYKELFVKENYYGGPPSLGEIGQCIINKTDIEEAAKNSGLGEEIFNYIKDNYKDIVFRAIAKSFTDCLFGPSKQGEFMSSFYGALDNMLSNYIRKG